MPRVKLWSGVRSYRHGTLRRCVATPGSRSARTAFIWRTSSADARGCSCPGSITRPRAVRGPPPYAVAGRLPADHALAGQVRPTSPGPAGQERDRFLRADEPGVRLEDPDVVRSGSELREAVLHLVAGEQLDQDLPGGRTPGGAGD